MSTIKHLYNPGDIVYEYWEVDGIKINIARYLIYDKEDVLNCYMKDVGYTSYTSYVMYTYDPYERDDRSGLSLPGDRYEIICWNDMDVLQPNYPVDMVNVVKSGLSWEEED